MKSFDRFLQRWRIAAVRPFIIRGADVLDIGCADGALARLVPHLGGYTGIDPDLPADCNIEGGKMIKGLFPINLPEPREFDAITMLAVLEHVPSDQQATLAADCARHLKPGGVVLITAPSPLVDIILAILKFLRVIDGMSLEQHYGFKPAQTPAIFGGAGLRLVKAGRFQFGLNNLFVFQRPGGMSVGT